MTAPRHLLSVWNPSYAEDAMDQHLRVFLRWARRAGRGEAGPDDVYVWWGKIRSPNRQQPLPHASEVLDLKTQIDGGTETHLYLTDYSSLYVGHLVEVTDEDVPGEWDEADHMPGYYADVAADFWFRLWDIRRLVAGDTAATIAELQKLRNTRYHDRPVSLYGGIVELPLILTRDDGATFFQDLGPLTEGRRWAERDAELRGETERLSGELRENLFGHEVWDALEPASRTFVPSAEAVFRARREDPDFDFSGPAVELAKAVEVELNALVFPALERVLASRRPADREVRVDGRPLDLGGRASHQTLGTIRGLLEREAIVKTALSTALSHDARWLEGELPHLLAPIIELRNPAAHKEAVSHERMGRLRRDVLGIGCEGLLVRIARAKIRAGK